MSYQCRDPVSGRVTTFVYNKEWVSGAGAGAGAGRVPVGKPASSLGTALQRALFVHGDPAQVFTDESQTSLLGPTELKKKLKCLGRTEKQTQAGGNPYPGLDDVAWDEFRCCRHCRVQVMSATGSMRAKQLKAGRANYRLVYPETASDGPHFLMCGICTNEPVATGTSLLDVPHVQQENGALSEDNAISPQHITKVDLNQMVQELVDQSVAATRGGSETVDTSVEVQELQGNSSVPNFHAQFKGVDPVCDQGNYTSRKTPLGIVRRRKKQTESGSQEEGGEEIDAGETATNPVSSDSSSGESGGEEEYEENEEEQGGRRGPRRCAAPPPDLSTEAKL